jgi:hypothetical protein
MSLTLSTSSIDPARIEENLSPMRERASRGQLLTRLFALALFMLVAGLLIGGSVATYHAMSDAMVSPIVVSSDNEGVIQSKLAMNRLLAEQQSLNARLQEGDAVLNAKGRTLELLAPLSAAAAESAARASANLSLLERQRTELQAMMREQVEYVAELRENMAANLIRKADLTPALTTLHQLSLALLANERDRLAGLEQLASVKAEAAQREIEIVKQETEQRSRLAHQAADEQTHRRLGELVAQMKGHPVFRAGESRPTQYVAFVSYKQLDKVHLGNSVYECNLWGLFGCRGVGTVSEVLPGEVVSQESGAASRGQYAILDLHDAEAAKSKTLRVRPGQGMPIAARAR